MSFGALKRTVFLSLAVLCLGELTHFGHAEEFFCGHTGDEAHCCAAADVRCAAPTVAISVPDVPPQYPPAAPALKIPCLLSEDIFHPPAA